MDEPALITPAASAPADGPPQPRPFSVGTLRYSSAQLVWLFAWLLLGDFVFMIINQIEPRILSILLKLHLASDQQIAVIIGSIPAAINLVVNPIASYRSDRMRSRFGRRIPYLFWATPFVSVFLALTPFAPDIARRMGGLPWMAHLLQGHGWSPVVLVFGGLVLVYQCFQNVMSSIYFYLFRDVVPSEVMGRFLALMRVFSALAIFVLNYWLLGLVETHAKAIFIAVAIVNLIGFMGMCRFVKEGDYPPVTDKVATASGLLGVGPFRAATNFVAESFTQPLYWWTYLARLLLYAAMPVSAFLTFFAQREIGVDLDTAGKLMAWPSIAWLLVAYPAGLWLDRRGAQRLLTVALWILAVGNVLSFFLVEGKWTFFTSSLVIGIGYWLAMLSQTLLAQEIFHPQRMGQLCSANVLVQCAVVAAIVGPLSGWLLDTLRLPGDAWLPPVIGGLAAGPYRFAYLLIATMYFFALISMGRLRTHWLRHGGPEAYQPPL